MSGDEMMADDTIQLQIIFSPSRDVENSNNETCRVI